MLFRSGLSAWHIDAGGFGQVVLEEVLSADVPAVALHGDLEVPRLEGLLIQMMCHGVLHTFIIVISI